MLDHLQVFEAVARHRNVTRASRELHISQPAVTKHLRLLEQAYSAKFYKRGGEGIELTEIGQIFLRDVKALLKQHARLIDKINGALARDKSDSLSVGGTYSPSASLLPSLLAGFKKAHPDLRLNLQTGNKVAMERMVLNGEIDVAVVNNARPNRLLNIEPYRQEPLVAFVSKHYPLSTKQPLTRQDFERLPLLIRKSLGLSGTAELFLHRLKKKGFRLNIAMRCDSPETVKAFVKRQMGAGILFRETVEPEIRRGEFKVVKLPERSFEGQSFIVYRKDRKLSPMAQAFLDLLRKRR
jgi:DNA-binding transcriptional LysR family regulator